MLTNAYDSNMWIWRWYVTCEIILHLVKARVIYEDTLESGLDKMKLFKITSFHFYFQLYLYFPPHPHQDIIHLDNLYLRWKRKRFFIFYLVIGGSNLLYYWCWRKGGKNKDLTAFVRSSVTIQRCFGNGTTHCLSFLHSNNNNYLYVVSRL